MSAAAAGQPATSSHLSSDKPQQSSDNLRRSSSYDTSGSPYASIDIESGVTKGKGKEEDPLMFQSGLKTEEELDELRRRKKGRKLERFHREQNDLIESLLKSMDEHTEEAKEVEEAARLPVKIAVWASLLANFALCVLQLYAAISSGSLSLLATGIDSVFDIGSNVMLVWIHRKAHSLDVNKWPVGGSRLETIGNIVYGFLMGSVNLVVIVESMHSIIDHGSNELKEFHIPSLIAVGAALGVKLLLFIYCYSIRKNSSQVHVLWEDHRNDLFINGFGLLMSAGGSKWRWWLDPAGAIIIAAGVIASWSRTIYKQFELLAGKSAPHDFIKLLTYKAMTFSEVIEQIDTIRAYHSGPEYFVEIDVVMPAETPLWKAHDLSQQLQDKIEVLPNVGRAFVHVDHETTHTPEHRKVI
ncbi:CDF manganese transporter [Fomitiporia mediterranea MF3/22]|uniref:CDF manganese transporter n=1 Tax=Fomitiporia mediterranea (strain MF3/22) TaxID=694068 RepID=UPI000440929C|nr:CDF manganese transporter [Fomitiporia mediterranea MF3/22]EJC98684.1 CDF manganese transporter [Fomitiporia mediterranea MF3/22]